MNDSSTSHKTDLENLPLWTECKFYIETGDAETPLVYLHLALEFLYSSTLSKEDLAERTFQICFEVVNNRDFVQETRDAAVATMKYLWDTRKTESA